MEIEPKLLLEQRLHPRWLPYLLHHLLWSVLHHSALPKPRAKKVDDDSNEIEEPDPEADMDLEELAKKYARKFQSQIYPDSFILLRG